MIAAILIGSMLLVPAQTRLATATPTWTGSVRCEIDIRGPGYANHQTHTWTLTGAVAADGSPLDYPATWSVTGAGSLQPAAMQTAAATWKTQGTAPGVRIAIYVRQSDQRLLVFLRNSQLTVRDGTILVRQPTPTAQLRNQPVSTPIFEWRPFPVIVDVPTSTHITGSSTTPITERLDAMQPLGSLGQAACTWDLAQSAGGAVSGAASGAAAAAGVAGAGAGAAATSAAGAIAGAGASAKPGVNVADGAAATAGGAAPPSGATATATRTTRAAPAGGAAAVAPSGAAAAGGAAAGAAPPGAAATGGSAAAGAAGSAASGASAAGPVGASSRPLSITPAPAPTNAPNTCVSAAAKTVNVSTGQSNTVTGAIASDGAADWLVVRFPAGTSVRLTVSNAASAAAASNIQVEAYSSCASLLVMTTGTGTKTLDFADSGPHQVFVRIGANLWNASYPTYTLTLEGR